jgi:aldehyde dehydrogenase (NAD+)
MTEIRSLVQRQKTFFNTGQTKDARLRKTQLDTLQRAIDENQENILRALQQDLAKSAYEGYLTEVGIVLDEIRFIKRHLLKWTKARRVRTHLFQFPGSS